MIAVSDQYFRRPATIGHITFDDSRYNYPGRSAIRDRQGAQPPPASLDDPDPVHWSHPALVALDSVPTGAASAAPEPSTWVMLMLAAAFATAVKAARRGRAPWLRGKFKFEQPR
jgi:hypothetical protein